VSYLESLVVSLRARQQQSSLQELYRRRQAALELYRQQYERLHPPTDRTEDEIDYDEIDCA